MHAYVFDFGQDPNDVTLCAEVWADTEAGAAKALRTYLDSSPRSDGPYVVRANDPAGAVQELRFYFNRDTEDITEEQIGDDYAVTEATNRY